jgi:hypothetical protein
MRDCPNAEIRDLLPDLLHERLDEGARVLVLSHVGGCEDCTEELALLRALRDATAVAPSIDIARIAAAIPPATRPRLARTPARTWRSWGAGATLALAAGVGAVMVMRDGGTPATMEVRSLPIPPVSLPAESAVAILPGGIGATPSEERPPISVTPVESRELALALDLSDVSDGDLAAILAEIEGLDALPSSDPEEPLPTPARGGEGEGEGER